MWLAEYDIDVYNAPEVFSVPPLTRLILPVMSGHVRALTGSLISGLNQTGAIAGAFADSSGEGSSNYAGGVYHSLWRSFRASRSVATYGRIYSGVTVDAVYVLIIIKT